MRLKLYSQRFFSSEKCVFEKYNDWKSFEMGRATFEDVEQLSGTF